MAENTNRMVQLEQTMAELRRNIREISCNVELLIQRSTTRSSDFKTITINESSSLLPILPLSSDSIKNPHSSSEPSDACKSMVVGHESMLLIEPEMECISSSSAY